MFTGIGFCSAATSNRTQARLEGKYHSAYLQLSWHHISWSEISSVFLCWHKSTVIDHGDRFYVNAPLFPPLHCRHERSGQWWWGEGVGGRGDFCGEYNHMAQGNSCNYNFTCPPSPLPPRLYQLFHFISTTAVVSTWRKKPRIKSFAALHVHDNF